MTPATWNKLVDLCDRRKRDPYGRRDPARVSWSLFFKHESEYLTNEGFPLGTTCWVLRLEAHGRRHLFCHEQLDSAVEAAVEWLRTQDAECPEGHVCCARPGTP